MLEIRGGGGGGFCDTCGLRGKCENTDWTGGTHGSLSNRLKAIWESLLMRNLYFGYQKAQSISSTGPTEAPGASLAGKRVSLGLRTAPLTLLALPATLSAPRKTWAFPARRHQPGPREAAAATAHQLFSPTPAGAGPALFALSQPGPVRPGPWALRVGRSAGRWMGRWEREAGWLREAAGTGGRDRGRITLSPPA